MIRITEPPLQTAALAKYPFSPALVKKFSTVSRFGDPLVMYEASPDKKFLYVPRACCPVGPNDNRAKGFATRIHSKFVPRNSEQQRVIAESLGLLQAGKSFIIQAGTGTGKTVMSLKLIDEIGVCALVVASKDDLVKQWIARIQEHCDIKRKDIGLIQQDVCQVYGKKIVVASLHSLAIPDRYPSAIRSLFGIVVFDEVHRLGAETFSKVAGLFPAKLRLGLSAEPRRVDGKEIVFFSHIGPIRVVSNAVPLKPKVLIYDSNWTCPRVKNAEGKIRRIPHVPGRCGHVVNILFKDRTRNYLIASLAKKAFDVKRRTTIFSTVKDHLDVIEAMLVRLGVPTSGIGHYYGTMKSDQLARVATKGIILATPGKMGDGTDIPWIDTCILAAPISDVRQIVGRHLREYPDKKVPVVFDIRDNDSHVFEGYAKKRDAYYASVGATVQVMTMGS